MLLGYGKKVMAVYKPLKPSGKYAPSASTINNSAFIYLRVSCASHCKQKLRP